MEERRTGDQRSQTVRTFVAHSHKRVEELGDLETLGLETVIERLFSTPFFPITVSSCSAP